MQYVISIVIHAPGITNSLIHHTGLPSNLSNLGRNISPCQPCAGAPCLASGLLASTGLARSTPRLPPVSEPGALPAAQRRLSRSERFGDLRVAARYGSSDSLGRASPARDPSKSWGAI